MEHKIFSLLFETGRYQQGDMLIIVRIIVLCLLLSGTLIFGFLPLCMRQRLHACHCPGTHVEDCETKWQRLGTSFLVIFSGGVLLATCLVHLLHEVHQGFEEAVEKCSGEKSGVADEAIVSMKTFGVVQNNEKRLGKRMSNVNSSSKETGTKTDFVRYDPATRPFQSVLEKEAVYDNILCSRYIIKTMFPVPEFITACGFFLMYFVEELIRFVLQHFKRPTSGHNGQKVKKLVALGSKRSRSWEISHELDEITSRKPTQIKISDETPVSSSSSPGSKQGPTVPGNQAKSKPVSNSDPVGHSGSKTFDVNEFVVILALSFNAVFEGFAAGFQHTEISTWMLFVSLALHKFVTSFVLSMEILHGGGHAFKASAYVVMFSFMCPVGMLVALVAHNSLVETGSLQVALLNALSVGSLLYVTFYEMLKQRRVFSEFSGFTQLFILVLGFITMSTIEYFYTRNP